MTLRRGRRYRGGYIGGSGPVPLAPPPPAAAVRALVVPLQVSFEPAASDVEIGQTLRAVGRATGGQPILVTMRSAS